MKDETKAEIAALKASWTAEELPGLLDLLNRALNTWEPANRPEWALGFADRVEKRIAVLTEQAKIAAAMNSDELARLDAEANARVWLP